MSYSGFRILPHCQGCLGLAIKPQRLISGQPAPPPETWENQQEWVYWSWTKPVLVTASIQSTSVNSFSTFQLFILVHSSSVPPPCLSLNIWRSFYRIVCNYQALTFVWGTSRRQGPWFKQGHCISSSAISTTHNVGLASRLIIMIRTPQAPYRQLALHDGAT